MMKLFGRQALIAVCLCLAAGTLAVAAASNLGASTRPAEAPSVAAAPRARIWYPAARAPTLALPGGQRRTIRSILNITAPIAYGSFVWNETGIPPAAIWVRIDLGRQLISVFRGGHEIGAAVILYGADGKSTPAGAFKILQKAKDYRSHTYDAPMPYMLRLTNDGVAIHASNVRSGFATHGCIGVPEEFARKLFEQAQLGDLVVVIPTVKSRAAFFPAERES
jgi:hypothetical protein